MNKAIAIGLVIAGAVMLVIGFSAKDSLASQTSELFHDAPISSTSGVPRARSLA